MLSSILLLQSFHFWLENNDVFDNLMVASPAILQKDDRF